MRKILEWFRRVEKDGFWREHVLKRGEDAREYGRFVRENRRYQLVARHLIKKRGGWLRILRARRLP